MFLHVLSCSFIFFHFLSFSLSLLGAQNLIFSGLNFVTKINFWAHLGWYPFGPSFPFFPVFSPVFFCLFSCSLFFHFSHFWFISSFWDFLMFFIFFFHFDRRKSFFFSFFLYFLQIFFLLALVSEFKCFLRSRCSMEMWCPYDIGRDSWDWVGPPAWGRACFNSPEWGGGSSPVKTEPPQIVLLLLLFWTRSFRRNAYVHKP